MHVQIRDLQTDVLYRCRLGDAVRIGRAGAGAGIACNDPHVSRKHCTLEALPDGRLKVSDNSSYGTFINGHRVSHVGYARVGDRIVLGYQYALHVVATIRTSAEAATVAETQGSGVAPLPALPEVVAGRYQVRREIGRGGMGVVYEAFDDRLGRPCALKLLTRVSEAENVERFKREARLSAILGDYPSIVRTYDHGRLADDSALFLVMDYVDGVSLASLIKGGLTLDLGVRLVARTARAVEYAHQRGVVHRDLKPANVLVTRENSVRLTDFGIAKEDGSGLTVTGIAMGTPNYMAPEQIEDSKRVGPAADVYGLGALLYAVLTGRPPYEGKRVGQVLRRVQAGDLVPPTQLVAELDPRLDATCVRALAVELERRHASAGAFARELEEWLKEHRGQAEPVRLTPPGT